MTRTDLIQILTGDHPDYTMVHPWVMHYYKLIRCQALERVCVIDSNRVERATLGVRGLGLSHADNITDSLGKYRWVNSSYGTMRYEHLTATKEGILFKHPDTGVPILVILF